MSNTLTKDLGITVLTPAVPGNPGVAPTPAYCATVSKTTTPVTTTWVQDDDGLWYAFYSSPGPVTTTTTTCYPATPGVPPTPGIPANVVTNFNLGWGDGARSIGSLAANGAALFSASAGMVGGIVGLDSGIVEFSYAGAEHALYFHNNTASVLENGVLKTGALAYVPEDVFRIERTSSVVRYFKNTTLIYTSANPSYGTQYLEASLYSGGDAVLNASLVETVTAGLGGSGDAAVFVAGLPQAAGGTALMPLSASGSGHLEGDAVTGYAYGDATLAPMTAAATGITEQGGGAVMAPLQAVGANYAYSAGSATLAPLAATGEAGTAPTFALGAAQLGYIGSAGYGLTSGNTTGEAASSTMAPMNGMGSNYAYGGGSATLEPLTGYSAYLAPLALYAFITAPMATLYAQGHDSTGENAADITAPMATLAAYLGMTAKIKSPTPTLGATATGTNWLTANVTAPMATLEATGTVSGTSRANITAPMATLIGYGGMVCNVTITGRPTLEANITSGGFMSASITGPMAILPLFEVTAEAYCNANIIAPMGKMGGQLQAWITAPMATLTAIGTATITATYEAYAINLNHKPRGNTVPVDEATRYTNFPFTHVVRYQNSYYGANSTGLYLLEGTTDAGTAIPWAVKTAMTDFDSPTHKTVASAYFGGRLGPADTITLHAGEGAQTQAYSYTTPRGALAQNYRQVFGKGIRKHRYYSLAASGSGEFELDDIELDVVNMTRRI